jgi:hypothetical protein
MSFAMIRDCDGDTISVGHSLDVGNNVRSKLITVNIKEEDDCAMVVLTKAEAMLLAKMLQNAVWEVTQNEHV